MDVGKGKLCEGVGVLVPNLIDISSQSQTEVEISAEKIPSVERREEWCVYRISHPVES